MANRIWLPDRATLNERATEINRLLGEMTVAEGKMGRRRWEAGVELLAAQRLVPRGEWERWCEDNIERSQNDIQKIMKMAASLDPHAAHEEEIAAKRDAREKTRDERADTIPYSASPGRPIPGPEQIPAPSPTSNQPPKLTLVPKVDAAEQVVDAWLALSPVDKDRAFDQIVFLRSENNVARQA